MLETRVSRFAKRIASERETSLQNAPDRSALFPVVKTPRYIHRHDAKANRAEGSPYQR